MTIEGSLKQALKKLVVVDARIVRLKEEMSKTMLEKDRLLLIKGELEELIHNEKIEKKSIVLD